MLSTLREMDNQINVMDGYQSIVDSVIRTTGYIQRYERFARYLNDHHTDEWILVVIFLLVTRRGPTITRTLLRNKQAIVYP